MDPWVRADHGSYEAKEEAIARVFPARYRQDVLKLETNNAIDYCEAWNYIIYI